MSIISRLLYTVEVFDNCEWLRIEQSTPDVFEAEEWAAQLRSTHPGAKVVSTGVRGAFRDRRSAPVDLDEVEALVDDLQGVLETPKPRIESANGLNALIRIPPVTLIGEHFVFGQDDEDDWIFHPEDVTPDLLSEVNVAIINPHVTDHPGVWAFHWVRTLTDKERRRCRRFSRHMMAHTHGAIIEGKWISPLTDYYSWIGGRWTDAIGDVRAAPSHAKEVWGRGNAGTSNHDLIQTLISMALTQRYVYSACLSTDSRNLSARIFAYPSTLRFMLKTRELGNSDRRRALVHLVKGHLRRRRKPYWARDHLRGEHYCQWAGMDVRVLPSQYDAERSAGNAVLSRLRADGMARYVPTS